MDYVTNASIFIREHRKFFFKDLRIHPIFSQFASIFTRLLFHELNNFIASFNLVALKFLINHRFYNPIKFTLFEARDLSWLSRKVFLLLFKSFWWTYRRFQLGNFAYFSKPRVFRHFSSFILLQVSSYWKFSRNFSPTSVCLFVSSRRECFKFVLLERIHLDLESFQSFLKIFLEIFNRTSPETLNLNGNKFVHPRES